MTIFLVVNDKTATLLLSNSAPRWDSFYGANFFRMTKSFETNIAVIMKALRSM